MKQLGGLVIRAVRPQESNDISDIKTMLREHRDEVRKEMVRNREVQAKLFDQIAATNATVSEVAQRVSRVEGRLNGGM